jgi:hypothetical protein
MILEESEKIKVAQRRLLTMTTEKYRNRKHRFDISDVLIWGGIAIVVIWIVGKLTGVLP